MFGSEGVGAVRCMVGTCGKLVAGVVNGEGDRTRMVSVVGRDSSDSDTSRIYILQKSLYARFETAKLPKLF